MTVAVPRLPLATGRPGKVDAGLGLMPGLDHDRPVAWFQGTATAVDAEVIERTITAGVDAGLPIIGVLDGIGVDVHADLPVLQGWGAVARALVGASGLVPTIAVVNGPWLGGPALGLGLVDLVIMTERATAYVNTPATSARFTGVRDLDAELLGGAWAHHSRSGVADLLAADLDAALALAADVLDHLPPNSHETPPVEQASDPPDRPCAQASSLVPQDARASYDMRSVIEDMVDDSAFLELRPRFGASVVCGLARIAGMPIGVVANQPNQLAGAIDIEGSQKGARFVRWCDAFNVPLVTLVDTPGFRPGRDQEWRGMIRHGAKLAFAFAEATVPRVSIVLRKAYGGAYIVMDCKSMGNDCALAWPSAEIAVMGAKGAVEILHGRALAAQVDEQERERRRLELQADYETVHLSPAVAADRGYIDEVIAPIDSRRAVAGTLAALLAKREHLGARRHENIPL